MNSKIDNIINSKKIYIQSKGDKVDIDDEGVQKATELVRDTQRKRLLNPQGPYRQEHLKGLETIAKTNSVSVLPASTILSQPQLQVAQKLASEPQVSANATEEVKEEVKEEEEEEVKEGYTEDQRNIDVKNVIILAQKINEKMETQDTKQLLQYQNSDEYKDSLNSIRQYLTRLDITIDDYEELKTLTEETYPTNRKLRGKIQRQINNMLRISGYKPGRKSIGWKKFNETLNDSKIVKLYKNIAIAKTKVHSTIPSETIAEPKKPNIHTFSEIVKNTGNSTGEESNNPTKNNI
jgi:hypothetical protein